MSTAKQMQVAIGARIMVRCEEMQIECIVEDVKERYGQARLQVRPVNGTGQQWVEMGRVSLPANSNIPENHATMHALGMCQRLSAGCKVCASK